MGPSTSPEETPLTPDPKVTSPMTLGLTPLLALDCEMVGVGEFRQNALARVSIVNQFGNLVYDAYAKPDEEITEYRTVKSGIRPQDLENAPAADSVRDEVAALVRGRVLVGHSIRNDLRVLKLDNHTEIRDTAVFYRKKLQYFGHPSLKMLAKEYLKLDFQGGEHSSVDDAKVTLQLYLLHQEEWEKELIESANSSLLPQTPLDANDAPPPTPIASLSIHPTVDDIEANSASVFLRKNLLAGAYASTQHYADVQFRLMREDLLRPIRDRVNYIRRNPHITTSSRGGGVKWIFKGVQLKMKEKKKEGQQEQDDPDPDLGFEVKGSGLLRIPIDANNLREIEWDDSKLFMGGSLLLVSPDSFKTVKLAVVSRRPWDKEVKEEDYFVFLHVYFIIDGVSLVLNKWHKVMVVESPAYFEAYRHTLRQFHTLNFDRFALRKYIIEAETRPHLPGYLRSLAASGKLCLDFSVFLQEYEESVLQVKIPSLATLENLNIDVPAHHELGWDESQHRAFFSSLFQELSIIQGPPGTGKTFLGLQLMKFFLTQQPSLTGDAPILIIAYTNHALDQSLELVYDFLVEREGPDAAYQSVLRFGGGCKSEKIIPLVMKEKEENYLVLKKKLKELEKRLEHFTIMESVLSRLKETGVFDFEDFTFERMPGIVNFFSLPEDVIKLMCEEDEMVKEVWSRWLGFRYSKKFLQDPAGVLGFEAVDVGSGRLKIGAADDFFHLKCTEEYVITCPEDFTFDPAEVVVRLLKPASAVSNPGIMIYLYFYLLQRLKELALSFPLKRQALETQQRLLLLKFKKPLKDVKVIGMTTTGAVKFKKCVHKLKPKITFVEEAAHVLESHVVASLTEDMEQLILIGDHQQLRPLTADHDLTHEYSLDVSLMERLVRNGILQGRKNWVQLNVQHRMRPDIADLIRPVIYRELYDHPCVHTWPSVKGVERNLFFLDHKEINSREKYSTSYVNHFEAKFVFDLVHYLVGTQGYSPSSITVIASYAAQKFLIQKDFKEHSDRFGSELSSVLVSTIDGYQGEQNDIIIFSLVRSNKELKIGFLKTDNRVCVALSRARHGFYMVGNMRCLEHESDTWRHINQVLAQKGSIGPRLPLTNGLSLPRVGIPASPPAVRQQPKNSIPAATPPTKQKKPSPSSWLSHHLSSFRSTKETPKQNQPKRLLPCGHKKPKNLNYVPADQFKCIETVLKKLPCGHERNDHCHMPVDTIQCNQRVSSVKFPCGHEYTYPTRCGEVKSCIFCPIAKKSRRGNVQLPCGHFSSPSQKCSTLVHKSLPCGHNVKLPCSTAACRTLCDRRVLKATFNGCGHELEFPPPGARCSKLSKCNIMVARHLGCGHKKNFPCHRLPAFGEKCSACVDGITNGLAGMKI